MKIFFRIIGGIFYFLLLLLKPILMVLSSLSGVVLSIFGVFCIFIGIYIFTQEWVDNRITSGLLTLIIGSLCMLSGSFAAYLLGWYEMLHERLGDFVFGRSQNDDFLM